MMLLLTMRRAIQCVLAATIAATASLILCYAFRDPIIGTWPKLLLVLIAAGAAAAPSTVLLLLVATIPIAFLGSLVSAAPFHEAEAMVIAAICGGGWRVAVNSRDDPIAPDLWPPLGLIATVVTCSFIVMLADTFATDPSLFKRSIVQAVTDDYLRQRGVLALGDQGIFAIESLLLFIAATRAACGRPEWTAAFSRMLVSGAAGAAALNVTRLMQVVLRSAAPVSALGTALHSIRINTGYGDVNAAGSYFALAGVVACGMALTSDGLARLATVGLSALLAIAAWLTGSRAAVAAAILGVAGLLAGRLRAPSSRRSALYGLGICALAAVGFFMFFSNPFTGPDARLSVTVRLELARIALRMFATRPFFGVGIGAFYATSGEYLAIGPLRDYYVRENAHNNILQFVAELGAVGTVAAGWLIVVATKRWRQAKRTLPADERALFHVLTAANMAFVSTMLLGHPLLTPSVSYTFALTTGAMVGMPRNAPYPRRAGVSAVAAIGLLLLALPFRIHDRIFHANMEHVGWGVGEWEYDATGEKMRRPMDHATLFVPPDTRWIELPYRLATSGTPVRFAVMFRGHRA